MARCIRAGDVKLAHRYAGRLAGIFEEDAYLGLELHTPEDNAIAREVVAVGSFLGLPPVVAQPIYCLEPEEAPRLRLLAAINRNCPLDAVPASALPGDGAPDAIAHWLSHDAIATRFAEFPEALEQVGEIAARCAPALPKGHMLWPTLDLPDNQTPEEALTALAHKGLAEKYPNDELRIANHESRITNHESPITDEDSRFTHHASRFTHHVSRLEKELTAITANGFAPLFLIVADVVHYAREHDVPVSTRGSVANSLVAYCTGITTVDPIAHDLLFERFLDPGRTDPPDIDLDFCSRRRDEVLAYVRDTYGEDRVAMVATISTMQPRSAARETAKAYGLDEAQVKQLLKVMPHRLWHPDPRRRDNRTVDEVLAEFDDPLLRKVAREAYGIIGLPHHLSVHPGGVVITPGPLTDTLPVQWAPKGFLITQFDHRDVEAVGLPKIDMLGIRALTVLADTADLVRRDHDPHFRLDDIPLDDPLTAEMIAQGDTIGVFQCDSEGARRTLRQLNARTVRDLAVANAFFKPGPATGGMAEAFVRRYRGEAPVTFLHPALEPILVPTQGVLLFQEQILRVATEIAGLTWEEAGHLRRGMSKMDRAEMAQMQTRFEAGCQRKPPDGPGFTAEQAHHLWEQVHPFSGYGFNQGHATAYADVSYRSAYLRAHWPAAFFCARLKDWGGYHHPAVYMAEAIRLDIDVRPPHVNHSESGFSLAWEGDQPVLWMGLGLIRDLRYASARALVRERQQSPFANIRDVLLRVPLQEKEVTHLIQCGALDGLGASRAALRAEARMLLRAGNTRQLAFDFVGGDVLAESSLQRLTWEQRLVGYPFRPLQALLPGFADLYPDAVPLRSLSETPGRRAEVIGVRLPGWGRQGFYLWDGDTWELVKIGRDVTSPPVWEPVRVTGHWARDRWGMAWLQTASIERLVW